MLDMLTSAVSGASGEVIRWSELGLRPGIDLGFFELKYYSLAYLAGIIFAYWHLSKMIKAPGAPMEQIQDLRLAKKRAEGVQETLDRRAEEQRRRIDEGR